MAQSIPDDKPVEPRKKKAPGEAKRNNVVNDPPAIPESKEEYRRRIRAEKEKHERDEAMKASDYRRSKDWITFLIATVVVSSFCLLMFGMCVGVLLKDGMTPASFGLVKDIAFALIGIFGAYFVGKSKGESKD